MNSMIDLSQDGFFSQRQTDRKINKNKVEIELELGAMKGLN